MLPLQTFRVGPWATGLEELACVLVSGRGAHLSTQVATPKFPFFFLYMNPILQPMSLSHNV